MDIKPSLTAGLPPTGPKPSSAGLDLKMHQLLEAKVIENQIALDKLTVKVDDKTLSLQTDRPLNLQGGQAIQLQVVKLLPQPEFKIVPTSLTPSPNITANPSQDTPTLKWVLSSGNASAHMVQPASFSLGQQLQASIVDVSNNKITLQLLPATTSAANAPTNTLLTLDAKQLIPIGGSVDTSPRAQTSASPQNTLSVGAQLTLQVIKTGDSPTFAVSAIPVDDSQMIVNALKQWLPIQAPPTALLNQLQQALPQLITDATLAEALKNLAQKILSSLPIKPQLTEASQLKQAIDESGLFLEHKLLQSLLGKPDLLLNDDFKAKLSKLIQLLNHELAARTEGKTSATEALLKESLQKAHGALAKLTVDQLNSLPKDDSPKQSWMLELPFFHDGNPESMKIQIERDRRKADDKPENNWAVSITISPPNLATIHCRISCYDGTVNTRFWSEAIDTVDRINAHLDYLKQQLEQKGIVTGFMEAHQGQPPTPDSIVSSMPHLLREKA